MSRRFEFVSPEGLRLDGRRPHELRSLSGTMGIVPQSEGSAAFEIGNTRVLATVFGPRETQKRSQAQHDRGTISVKFHAASFASSGGERRKNTRQDKRLQEWSKFVEETFASVVITSVFPRSVLDIFVEIVNADGGVLTAAMNAITLALLDAGIPMNDYVLGCSAAHILGNTLLDPNRLEETANAPVLSLALLPRSKRIVFMNSELRLAGDKVVGVVELISQGVEKIFEHLDTQVVRPHLHSLLEKRSK